MATYVYVDGLNFYYRAVKGTAYKWVDFAALARLLVPQDAIGLVRYFTAIVKPRYAGDRAPDRHNVLVRAIDSDPLVKVTKGHFRSDKRWRVLAEGSTPAVELFRPPLLPTADLERMLADAKTRRTKPCTSAWVINPEEKGSDVNLGSYLVYDALTSVCDKAVVITNDSDLAEPIRLVVGSGVPVGLVNPQGHGTSRHLRKVASFEIPFRRMDALPKCQMPNTVKDAKGREVHRPSSW